MENELLNNENNEYGLMIIWANARFKEREIVEDLKKRFEIINIFEISWEKEKFSNNLTRFYGENLPKNSFKEKHCGNGAFVLLILRDISPFYGYRPTSHGKRLVNVNFFDSKEMYRGWTGQHMIHATNDKIEFAHDLMMLLGVNIDDYFKKYEIGKCYSIAKNVVGSDGWRNLEEIFYVLNETIEYVVLRNFEKLPNDYQIGEHSDIDILTSNRYNFEKIINGNVVYKNKNRAKCKVECSDSFINIDVRSIGDNYLDPVWEKNILSSRIKNKCFFVPSTENHIMSLIYHALIQKKIISENYYEVFNNYFKKQVNDIYLSKILNDFMNDNNYEYLPCNDYSVFFNEKYCDAKGTWRQKFYFRFFRFVKYLERKR